MHLKKKRIIAICLDIKKAYDMIWKPNILKSLIQSKINSPILAFIINFLISRSIQVKRNGSLSDPLKIKSGISQKSTLNVTLFSIGINGVAKDIKNPIISHLFADDLTITGSGKNQDTLKELLQEPINNLQK